LRHVRVALLPAILGLSFQVLLSNACAHRHYTLTVREVVPTPAPRRTETFRGPSDSRSTKGAEASNVSGQPGSAQSSELVATTGDEPPSPRSMRGSSDTNAKSSGSIGGQRQVFDAAAGEESQPPMDSWFLLNGRLLLLGSVIGVAVLCVVLARRRVTS